MMDNAKHIPCDLLLNPKDPIYDEEIRRFQGCPTIAVTKGGRIFLAWYAGGTKEPHMENYNVLIKSEDGVNWSEPVLIIPSSKERLVHALDIQLWCAPTGELYVIWVQNNVVKTTDGIRPEGLDPDCPWVSVEGYDFPDFEHAMWISVCRNPDADVLVFEEPRCVDKGFLRCKPTVQKDGRWLFFNYDQLSDRYGYSYSDDKGKTFTHAYGPKKYPTTFDEAMAYEKLDGTVRVFARAHGGRIAEFSFNEKMSEYTEPKQTDIPNPDTRFYIGRTPSGRILLVNNHMEKGRTNMSVYLSEDDGETFKYRRVVDERITSYPDVDFKDGRIYLTVDHERMEAREILLFNFTEEDIMNEEYVFVPQIISKPKIEI